MSYLEAVVMGLRSVDESWPWLIDRATSIDDKVWWFPGLQGCHQREENKVLIEQGVSPSYRNRVIGMGINGERRWHGKALAVDRISRNWHRIGRVTLKGSFRIFIEHLVCNLKWFMLCPNLLLFHPCYTKHQTQEPRIKPTPNPSRSDQKIRNPINRVG